MPVTASILCFVHLQITEPFHLAESDLRLNEVEEEGVGEEEKEEEQREQNVDLRPDLVESLPKKRDIVAEKKRRSGKLSVTNRRFYDPFYPSVRHFAVETAERRLSCPPYKSLGHLLVGSTSSHSAFSHLPAIVPLPPPRRGQRRVGDAHLPNPLLRPHESADMASRRHQFGETAADSNLHNLIELALPWLKQQQQTETWISDL